MIQSRVRCFPDILSSEAEDTPGVATPSIGHRRGTGRRLWNAPAAIALGLHLPLRQYPGSPSASHVESVGWNGFEQARPSAGCTSRPDGSPTTLRTRRAYARRTRRSCRCRSACTVVVVARRAIIRIAEHALTGGGGARVRAARVGWRRTSDSLTRAGLAGTTVIVRARLSVVARRAVARRSPYARVRCMDARRHAVALVAIIGAVVVDRRMLQSACSRRLPCHRHTCPSCTQPHRCSPSWRSGTRLEAPVRTVPSRSIQSPRLYSLA